MSLDDGKMAHLKTKHSGWGRKYHTFNLCVCRKGEAVRNNGSHVCKMHTNKAYKRLYERSQEAFTLYRDAQQNENYDEKEHRTWCNIINNAVVTHFGLTPERLNIQSFYIDVFHYCC